MIPHVTLREMLIARKLCSGCRTGQHLSLKVSHRTEYCQCERADVHPELRCDMLSLRRHIGPRWEGLGASAVRSHRHFVAGLGKRVPGTFPCLKEQGSSRTYLSGTGSYLLILILIAVGSDFGEVCTSFCKPLFGFRESGSYQWGNSRVLTLVDPLAAPSNRKGADATHD